MYTLQELPYKLQLHFVIKIEMDFNIHHFTNASSQTHRQMNRYTHTLIAPQIPCLPNENCVHPPSPKIFASNHFYYMPLFLARSTPDTAAISVVKSTQICTWGIEIIIKYPFSLVLTELWLKWVLPSFTLSGFDPLPVWP